MEKMNESVKELIKGIYKKYGYDENMRINMDQFNSIVKQEKLDEYTYIDFNPTDLLIENMVALIREGEKYTVVSTGERATMSKKEFEELELALSYMIYKLRVKKDASIKDLNYMQNYMQNRQKFN